jgi:hypothetical protein
VRTALATQAAPGHANEDFAIASDGVAVLLDGATIPDSATTACTHSTAWFTRQLGARIFQRLTLDPDSAITDCVAEAIKTLVEHHGETCDTSHTCHPSATVVALREGTDALEYFVLGDSTLVLGTRERTRVITDRRLDHVQPALRERVRTAPRDTPEYSAARLALLEAERHARNTTDGYWIAAADPAAAYHAITGAVAPGELLRALLLSDGASAIVDRFDLLSWDDVLNLAERHGPHEVIRRVRDAETGPQGLTHPRSKPHDDATALLCAW